MKILCFSCLLTIPFEFEFKIQVRFILWLNVGTTLSWSRYAAHYTSCKHCSAAVVSAAVDTNVGRLHSSGQSLRTAPGAATCSGVMRGTRGNSKAVPFNLISF